MNRNIENTLKKLDADTYVFEFEGSIYEDVPTGESETLECGDGSIIERPVMERELIKQKGYIVYKNDKWFDYQYFPEAVIKTADEARSFINAHTENIGQWVHNEYSKTFDGFMVA